MKNTPSLVAFALCMLLWGILIGMYIATPKPAPGKLRQDPIDLPYSINILDDHEVRLISAKDTVTLFLENSARLSDEFVIFVKK